MKFKKGIAQGQYGQYAGKVKYVRLGGGFVEEIQVEEQSKNSKVKTVYYQPFSSSHVLLNDAMNDIQKKKKKR